MIANGFTKLFNTINFSDFVRMIGIKGKKDLLVFIKREEK